MKPTYATQRGFTLLELMVVIAIISILAAITAPTFTRQITKAKLVEAQNIASQGQSIIEEYILINGQFPSDTEFQSIAPNISEDSIVKTLNVSEQTDESGSLVITLNQDTGVSDGEYFKYIRDSDRNWSCESNLSVDVLPQQCSSLAAGS